MVCLVVILLGEELDEGAQGKALFGGVEGFPQQTDAGIDEEYAEQEQQRKPEARPQIQFMLAAHASHPQFVADALHQDVDASDFELCARLTALTGVPTPEAISELPTLPVRHQRTCTPEDMFKELMKEMNF